ncbi:MAG: hypothetical protein HY291_09335 [Planctomycetes bacterium]|nr:hypothetical protein [Planctomycetota bacterium]
MKPRFLSLLALAAALAAAAEEPPPAETIPLEASEDGTPLPLPVLDGEPALGRWVALRADRTKGSPEAYAWKQTGGPPLNLSEAEASSPRVWRLLEKPGDYRIELKAKNAKGWSPAVPLAFSVKDGEPALSIDQALTMTGAGEGYADGIFLPGESWKQLLGPEVRLTYDEKTKTTLFRALVPGLYLFEAEHAGRVPERRAFRVPAGADELMGDRRPEARLTLPQDGFVGQRVELDGSLSNDRDAEPLTAKWMSVDVVRGVTIKALDGLKAEFSAQREGVYRVRLIVSDGKLDSRPVETFVRVLKAADTVADPAGEDVPPDTDPLSRRVSLRCYESSLDRAVQRFPHDCNVTLRVRQELCPTDQFEKVPLDLGVEYAPVGLLLDWIARQSGGAYRRESKASVWLVKPSAWAADEELKNEVVAIDALYRNKDASDLLEVLRRPFRGILTERADAQLLLQADSNKAIAFLPLRACQRLKEMVAFLRAPKGIGIPPTQWLTAAEFLLRRKLAETKLKLDWQGRRIDWALRDLSEMTGVPAGFDPAQFAKFQYLKPARNLLSDPNPLAPPDPLDALPRITLKLDDVPFREAVREVVAAAGFDGCQPQNGAGLWFYKGGEPYPSGELLWDIAFVRAYPLDQVLARTPLLSGEVIAHEIRRKVYPDSWNDPATCCAYHASTGKLLIVHGEAAHVRIINFLNDLLERGEDALGPVQTAPQEK